MKMTSVQWGQCAGDSQEMLSIRIRLFLPHHGPPHVLLLGSPQVPTSSHFRSHCCSDTQGSYCKLSLGLSVLFLLNNQSSQLDYSLSPGLVCSMYAQGPLPLCQAAGGRGWGCWGSRAIILPLCFLVKDF